METHIKIKIYYTTCEETGDKIIDTDMMIEEWNDCLLYTSPSPRD